jgi:hypothetical protein
VVERYVHELARKLAPEGVAFLHHSNLAQYVDPATGLPPFQNHNWRGRTMSAATMREYSRAAGLSCIAQELVNWEMDPLNDCFSVLARPGSRFDRENVVRENPGFMEEAAILKAIAEHYGPTGFPAVEATPSSDKAAQILRRDAG